METVKSPAEQKVFLSNVSWETYERLLEERRENRVPRFTFDRGMLEIVSSPPEHEKFNRRIAQLVLAVTEEMGIEAEDLGSTTFRRADIERGFEPDSCFYIQNEERIRGKDQIDLDVDPPPDLVIEVDIPSPSINKLPIHARLGVPEVWRYDGKKLDILKLEDDGYVAVTESAALSSLTSAVVSGLIERSKSPRRTVWLREVRQKIRELSG